MHQMSFARHHTSTHSANNQEYCVEPLAQRRGAQGRKSSAGTLATNSSASSNIAAAEALLLRGEEEQQAQPSLERQHSITTTADTGQQQQPQQPIALHNYDYNGINRTSAGCSSSTISTKAPNNLDTAAAAAARAYTTSANGCSQQPQHNHDHDHNRIGGNGVIINTISGSIPATGLPIAQQHRSLSMIDGGNGGRGSVSALSLNSSTDLSAFPMRGSVSRQERHAAALQSDRKKAATIESVQRYEEGQRRRRRQRHAIIRERPEAGGYLWIVTPVAASISVAIVIAALAGPQWLYTEEKLPNINFNGTANFKELDDGAFITKYTKSSLWILCTTLQEVETYNCIKIDYFPKEGYQPDPLDSTPAIPYTVTKSCPYFLAAGIFLLISFIVFLVPTCSHQNNLYYFSAGIMFIVSGLLMLIGLIAYISILKAEIGSKLRPRSTLQPALFKVTYGQSFFLFVFGFISTEVVGLLNIFLYISLQEVSYYSRLPCFTITNIQQKIKEGENPRSQTHKKYQLPTTPGLSSIRSTRSGQHQVHHQAIGQTQLPAFACKKHPRSNALLSDELEHRYFFEKLPKCNLHPKNLTKSLNELYTEPAPPLAPPPPPSTTTICAARLRNGPAATPQGSQTLPLPATQFADLPPEFPLTRSVSTTTELCSNGASNGSCGYGNATIGNGCRNAGNHKVAAAATLSFEQKNRRNQATNTLRSSGKEAGEVVMAKEKPPNGVRQADDDDDDNHSDNGHNDASADTYDDDDDDETQQRLCGLRRGARGRRSRDEFFGEFCRRAGMRPRPKNIYYIDADGDGEIDAEADERERSERRLGRNEVDAVDNYSNRNRAAFADNDQAAYIDGTAEDDGRGHLFVMGDTCQQRPKHYAQMALSHQRRRSMHDVEAAATLRKLNSNLSLHSLYALTEKNYQKSLYNLDRCDSSAEMYQPEWHHDAGASCGGSQNRRMQHLDYCNQLQQSRTLPRSFLKRAGDSQDSLNQGSNQLLAAYILQQQQQQQLQLQQQQQQQKQQQQRYFSHSRNANAAVFHSDWPTLHKSCDDLVNSHHQPSFDGYLKRPTHVPAPDGSSSAASRQQRPVAIQWPAAIASSPSNFNAQSYVYADHAAAALQQARINHLQQQHALVARANSDGVPHKLQHGYVFDEQRRASAALDETAAAFDLDEIERERRRSHASLFEAGLAGGRNMHSEQHYDMINGTAV